MNLPALCTALREAGAGSYVPSVKAAAPHAIPCVVVGARRLLVRYAALPSEGKPGSLVAEWVLEDGGTELVATEDGPARKQDTGPSKPASIRFTPELRSRLEAHGPLSSVVIRACEEWLTRQA